MNNKNIDIRWIQRLNNYIKAFRNLNNAIEMYNNKKLSDLEKQVDELIVPLKPINFNAVGL